MIQSFTQEIRERFDTALNDLNATLPPGSAIEVVEVSAKRENEGEVRITLTWRCVHPDGSMDLRRTRWTMSPRFAAPHAPRSAA